MKNIETEIDKTPTEKLLENAIEGIQNKLAKIQIAAYQSEPDISARINACKLTIQASLNILKEIKGQL